ncbi:hypothetical protein [Vibrio neptunius]|uniref:hypothetical protein n=1 Tax=Vibrio neptunius TaxID=170651 RepID=UPI0019D21E7E|nr:hypothetical protein [Vibrio neptunius]MBN3572342.1 hypothetical protein [Vibrio neptunius]
MPFKNYGSVKGLKLSSRSRSTLKIIDYKVDLANYLSSFMITSPILEIFRTKGGGVINTAQDIYEYHWDEFGNAMASINPVLRKQVYNLAKQEALYTYGQEQKFWKCVSEAAL